MVKDVSVLDALRPLGLEVEGIRGREYTRTGHDLCRRGAVNNIKLSRLSLKIVFGVISLDFVSSEEMLQLYMALRIGPRCVRVVPYLVRRDHHIRCFDSCVLVKVAH